MLLKFKKKIVVGVSVSPERGLEVAQVDFLTRTVLKYASRDLLFDNVRKTIADIDIFKETLEELLVELEIPKGSEIVLNIPPAVFAVKDYAASFEKKQLCDIAEEELQAHSVFQDIDPTFDLVTLPNSTIQFTKTAFAASQKSQLIEIAMQIKELGYSLIGIDTSVNSTLSALIYNNMMNVTQDTSWLLVYIENQCCRIIPMLGRSYVDYYEEQISIGRVLGDEENYSIVSNAINPIIKNIPTQYLYVVSKTDLIDAEKIAEKLVYKEQVVHYNANAFNEKPFLEPISDEEGLANDDVKVYYTSLEVVGAAIYREFQDILIANFNLYNERLGDIYTDEQPLSIDTKYGKYVFSIENMANLSLIFAIIVAVVTIVALSILNQMTRTHQAELDRLNSEISKIEQFLKENKNISSDLFDEGDEIKIGLINNKNIYSYYTIVGTEIPKKLWLTKLSLGSDVTIEGQADNLQSIYSFFRSIKDYNTAESKDIKLQKLGLANSGEMKVLKEEEAYNTNSLMTSLTTDFYEFTISSGPEKPKNEDSSKKNSSKNKKKSDLPKLETIK